MKILLHTRWVVASLLQFLEWVSLYSPFGAFNYACKETETALFRPIFSESSQRKANTNLKTVAFNSGPKWLTQILTMTTIHIANWSSTFGIQKDHIRRAEIKLRALVTQLSNRQVIAKKWTCQWLNAMQRTIRMTLSRMLSTRASTIVQILVMKTNYLTTSITKRHRGWGGKLLGVIPKPTTFHAHPRKKSINTYMKKLF